MRRLSSIILSWLMVLTLFAQKSPHGEGFALNCQGCHNPKGWKVDLKQLSFDHGTTRFPLTGQHQAVSCRSCHNSLEFNKAGKQCNDCHTDMHNQTVGPDCQRCHTTTSWVVNNITEIHQRSRFPLVGAHLSADCYSCHTNAASNLLLFGPLGVECIDCHSADYQSAKSPDHVKGNYSTNCIECHNMTAFSWAGAGINHNFFPLTGGHEISDCKTCHKSPDYSTTSPECASCHTPDYNSAANPNHVAAEFSLDCKECHTTGPGWSPAMYRNHDGKYFPIYTGSHAGTWTSCSACHTNPSNYAQYTCIDCHDHERGKMDEEHNGVTGYIYNSEACFACHPTGDGEGMDHNTVYPLTGAHTTTECIKCHTNGYPNTPNTCAGCHTPNFNQSVNPPHVSLAIPTECETCHTTNPGWKPALFPIHNNYYVIEGAHQQIASDCFKCHQGNYTNTPNLCFGCHAAAYNQATNPNHITSNFPTTCETCHSQSAWIPASFNHNNVYPLTGAHATIANDCFACHKGSYVNTPNTCAGCHQQNYNQTTNPPHAAAQFPVTCNDCHSTSAWVPANWNHDSQYFPIYSGKHQGEWNTCADCHTNAANYSVFSCIDCHEHNQPDMDSEHQGISGYSYNSIACYNCHPTGSGDGPVRNFRKE